MSRSTGRELSGAEPLQHFSGRIVCRLSKTTRPKLRKKADPTDQILEAWI